MADRLKFREEIARRRMEIHCGSQARDIEWDGDNPEIIFADLLSDCGKDTALALDLECGGGYIARRAAGFAGSVVGVDISAAAVSEAVTVCAGLNSHFVCADSCHLPFCNCVFDFAYSHDGLDASIPGVLSEVSRVLAPGALFAAMVPGESRGIEAQGVFGRGAAWPSIRPVRFSVPEGLGAAGMETVYFAEYYGTCHYPDVDSFAFFLAASGVIPDFDELKDAPLLREVNRALRADQGVRDIEHVAIFIARKPG